MIEPTVGRVVWFTPAKGDTRFGYDDKPQGPFAAIVSYVWGPRMVNVMAITADGQPIGVTSVTLVQEGDDFSPEGRFCEWMPYQTGQAKKNV